MNTYRFDPVAVHEFAAQLYWRRAHRDGVANFDQQVLATAGEIILDPPLIEEVLFVMQPLWGIAGMPSEAMRAFKKAAASEAFDRVRQGEPLLGQVVFTDTLTGRAPGVEHFVQPDALQLVRTVPVMIDVNRHVPSLGKLVVRSPLPAIVVSVAPPGSKSTIIRVADTSALGVDLAIYLHVQDWARFGSEHYLVAGTFVIPAKDSNHGQAWSRLIPNSTRFYREFKAHGTADGDLLIATTW